MPVHEGLLEFLTYEKLVPYRLCYPGAVRKDPGETLKTADDLGPTPW
jgi:hypothetical protein